MNKEEELEMLNEKAKELFGELLKIMDFKPKFKIHIESDKKGKGRVIEVKGNKPSIMLALADLATVLIEESNLTEKDILYAINTGIRTAHEDKGE